MLEKLCNLLFELSNEDRIRILKQLDKKPMNITNIAKKLDLKVQEVSRHISRLSESRLTLKDLDSSYHITPYGKLVLDQLSGFEFISENMEYFSTHSIDFLPLDLKKQLGNLSDSRYIDDVMIVYQNIGKVLKEAKDYVWAIVDQETMKLLFWEPVISSAIPTIEDKIEKKVKIRYIEPKSWKVLPDSMRYKGEKRQLVLQAIRSRLLEHRSLENVKVFLYMSEIEVAVLAFPTLEEKFDHLGFTSKDEQFHNWCKNLFKYYWEKANPLAGLVL